MPRYVIQRGDDRIARYDADDACEALTKYLTDRYRASLRHRLAETEAGCSTSVEIDGETFSAHELQP